MGGVVVHKSARVAGNKIDEAIAQYVKKKYNLFIGERMAEAIKMTIGDAMPSGPPSSMEIRGRDTVTGLPRMVELTRAETTSAIMPVLMQVITAVKSVFEETPPELAADIIDKGIVMSGGTSLLRNFDKLMTQMTGVVCHVAEDALLCVVRGTGVAMENIELYKRSISRK